MARGIARLGFDNRRIWTVTRAKHFLLNNRQKDLTFFDRYLKYMPKKAETYPDEQIVQQVAAPISWFYKNWVMRKPDYILEHISESVFSM